jgi:hypothetical protein
LAVDLLALVAQVLNACAAQKEKEKRAQRAQPQGRKTARGRAHKTSATSATGRRHAGGARVRRVQPCVPTRARRRQRRAAAVRSAEAPRCCCVLHPSGAQRNGPRRSAPPPHARTPRLPAARRRAEAAPAAPPGRARLASAARRGEAAAAGHTPQGCAQKALHSWGFPEAAARVARGAASRRNVAARRRAHLTSSLLWFCSAAPCVDISRGGATIADSVAAARGSRGASRAGAAGAGRGRRGEGATTRTHTPPRRNGARVVAARGARTRALWTQTPS